jgi:hypothetical protein
VTIGKSVRHERDRARGNARDELLDDPIPLAEASKLLLLGIVTVPALCAEKKCGNLGAETIGTSLFTTPAAIREMREKCRVVR